MKTFDDFCTYSQILSSLNIYRQQPSSTNGYETKHGNQHFRNLSSVWNFDIYVLRVCTKKLNVCLKRVAPIFVGKFSCFAHCCWLYQGFSEHRLQYGTS